MFAKTIIDSDAFIDMPTSARLLYYDLAMRADDDGFVNSPKKIIRMTGASDDDLSVLILKKFIIPFESGVVVIKHWRIHNYIRKDTYNETAYKDEKSTLILDENKAYKLLDTTCIPPVDETSTQDRLGKDSIGKDSIDKSSIDKSSIEKVEDRESIDNRGYGGKKERERKEPNETSCPQYSSPSYPQSQQLTANDIVDLFNDICTTYPTVDGITQYSTALSNSLMFDRYSKADYSTIFQKAEQSSNLKARTHDEESPVDFGWILEHSKEIKDGAFDN